MLQKSIIAIISGLLFLQPFLNASPVINLEDHPSALIEMKELIPDHQPTRSELKVLKKEEQHLVHLEKVMKRMSKIVDAKKAKHSLGGIHDPVDKWFWIWITTWGVGILMTLILGGSLSGAALGILWLAVFALGSVALILWLIKKFG